MIHQNYILQYLTFMKSVRLGKRLSQQEAGKRTLGVSAAWVSNAESGEVPSDRTAPYVAALLKLKVRSRRTEGGPDRVGRRRIRKST